MLTVLAQLQFPPRGASATAIDASFTADAGVTVLFGPSGAGKTTILRMIAGIVRPDAGRIALGDRILFDAAAGVDLPIQQRRVGYVFQDHALFPHLTAAQNIAYGARPHGGQAVADLVGEWLARLHIEHAADRLPRELSGGEQQRVGLARALASDPALVLLDEPLGAVDAATRAPLLAAIGQVQRRSAIPFLYVTHSHAEAVRIGDALHVLDRGRVVQSGSPLAVFNAPQTVAAARIVGTENVFAGRVFAQEPGEGTTTVALDGCRVAIGYCPLALETPVTVGLRSEDILVARERITQTSARNVLAGVIKRVVRDSEKVELVVDCGADFKVSITAGTVRSLGLEPGAAVYLLIKARAFHLLA